VLPDGFDAFAPESARRERKATWNAAAEKIRETVCAFANDFSGSGAPAHVVIGVNDDGSCTGITVDDDLLTSLGNIRADNTFSPAPLIEVDHFAANGCDVAVITVHPSLNPPLRYRGRVWIRVGPRNQQASAEEERVLSERRRAADPTFDMRAVTGASLEDVSSTFISEQYIPSVIAPDVLEANNRTLVQQMMSLRLLKTGGEPTYGAIIAFGSDPERFVPGSYVQFLRLDGQILSDPIRDERRISGPLYAAIPALDDVLKANISTEIDVRSELTEIRRPSYPIVALRQLVFNALMHRNYESSNAPVRIYWFNDRIEINSPGRLYGQVNQENFGSGATDYRNPLVAEIMRGLGYVQRFGIGIAVAQSEMQKNGNPPVEFEFSDAAVLARLRSGAA
jgi:ATP-dependent DNA helicase RecG